MLIGFHAKKQGGKDTAYARLSAAYGGSVERIGFADLLYRSAAAALGGVTVEELQRWKSDPNVRVQVVCLGVDADSDPEDIEIMVDMDVRTFLQKYGTEAHREVFGSDFWVDAVELWHQGRIVCVTDVRFENEARAVRQMRGVIVKLLGPPEVELAGDTHESEAGLSDDLVDFIVDNSRRDDDFHSLDQQLRYIVAELSRGET